MGSHIVYLNGKDKPSFKCKCGCNVFHDAPEYRGHEVLACNACGAEYMTDRKYELEYQI